MSRTVADVMTRKVIAVRQSTPFKDIVGILRRSGVSAVPVVDSEDRVLGVVSEADVMLKEEALDREPSSAVRAQTTSTGASQCGGQPSRRAD